MNYEFGSKILLKQNLEAEIIGRSPQGQPITINFNSEPSYNCRISGVVIRLTQSQLDTLKENVNEVFVKEEKIFEDIFETQEAPKEKEKAEEKVVKKDVQIPKKRRGRPKHG